MSTGYYGKLKVTGKHLTDMNGTPVILRGVSTHSVALYPQFVCKETFQYIRDYWHINVVRMAMYTAEAGGYCKVDAKGKEETRALVHKGVHLATELGMYAIIDWHILEDYDPNINKEDAKVFFEEMSQTYKDYENVIYEICNEPNLDLKWESIVSYANEIIPIIRRNDPDAIIVVGTPTWSQDVDIVADNPLTGWDNIMYTLHFYAATHKDGLREKAAAAIKKNLPIFVTEFGICEASGDGVVDKEQGKLWLDFLEENNISYLMWNMANKDEESSFFRASCKVLSNFKDSDLNQSSAWYVKWLNEKK